MKHFVKPIVFVLFSVTCAAQTIPGTVIWSEDFDSVRWAPSVSPFDTATLTGNVLISQDLMPDGWTVGDATGNNFYWHWSQLGPRGRYTSMVAANPNNPTAEELTTSLIPSIDPEDLLASATADNGVMMLESDYFNSTPQGGMVATPIDMDSYIMTPAIDLSSVDGVLLVWQQRFRFCCSSVNSKLDVLVSTDYNENDPSTAQWTVFDARFGTLANAYQTENPKICTIDLSAVAAGFSNVRIKWRKQAASHYVWIIDDVQLILPVSYNVALNNVFADYLFDPPTEDFSRSYPGGYRFIPRNQMGVFSGIRAVIKNEGTSSISSSVHLKILKNDIESPMVGSYNSNTLVLPPNTSDTFKIAGPLTIPPQIGKFTFRVEAITDSLDLFPDNNTRNMDFYVTDTLYSRSSEKKENMKSFGINELWGSEYHTMGKYYYFPNQSVVRALRFFLSQSNYLEDVQNGYLQCRGHIYVGDSANIAQNIPLFSTSTFTLSPSDIGNFKNIPFDNNSLPVLQAGDYYFALECIDNNPEHEYEDGKKFWIGKDISLPSQIYDHGWPVSTILSGEFWGWVNENISISVIVESEPTLVSPLQINANMTDAISQGIFDPLTDSLFVVASFNEFGQEPEIFTPLQNGIWSFQTSIPTGDLIQFKLKINRETEEDTFRYFTINSDTTLNIRWNSVTQIAQRPQVSQLRVFPNPAKKILHFSLPEKVMQIRIFDNTGKMVKQSLQTCTSVEIAELSEGIYYVEIVGKTTTYRSKFVKK